METAFQLRSLADRPPTGVRWSSSRPCTGTIVVLGTAPRYADLVYRLAAAIEQQPRLRQRRVKRRGRPGSDWTEHTGFDPSFHLRWEMLGGEQDLLAVATRRFFRPFAREAPPWEVHVLEGRTRSLLLVRHEPSFDDDGTLSDSLLGALCEDDATATVVARADEQEELADPAAAIVATLEALLPTAQKLRRSALALLTAAREAAAVSGELARATFQPGHEAGDWPSDLASAALRTARSLGALVTAQLTENSPAAMLATTSARRGLALVDLPLAALDAVRRPLGLAIEDVLLSISAGALARLEREQRGSPPENLRALVSFPEAHRTGVLLPMGELDPLRRAADFHELLRALGGKVHLAAMKTLAGVITALPVALAGGTSPQKVPRYDLELAYREMPLRARSLAGARVQRIYPLAATGEASGLAVGAHCFDGWLSLGLAYDSNVVVRPQSLVEAWQLACGEFLHAAMSASARSIEPRVRTKVRAH